MRDDQPPTTEAVPEQPDSSETGEPTPVAATPEVLAALREYAREFVLLVTPDGRLVAGSDDDRLDLDDAPRGRHIGEFLHPEDLAATFDLIERARRTPGFRETIRVRGFDRRGPHWFEAEVIDATNDPRLRGAVVRVRRLDDTMPPPSTAPERIESRFFSLAEALPLGILSADTRGCVAFCNATATQILDLPRARILDHGWKQAIYRDDRADVDAVEREVLEHGVGDEVTFRVDTELFQRWAHARFVPLTSGGNVVGWVAAIEDITDRHRAESELAHRATHDALTDLPNRTLFEDRLRQAWGRFQRSGDPITVLFIDLDRFKEVNDTHGHAAGDTVLRTVAERLSDAIRDVDTLSRLGGDEFVILCEGLDESEIDPLRARLDRALAEPIDIGSDVVDVGASIGVARSSRSDRDPMEILVRADQAMYRKKHEHRTRQPRPQP